MKRSVVAVAGPWNRSVRADFRVCNAGPVPGRRRRACWYDRIPVRTHCGIVAGAYEHRRAALQAVRFAIEDATGGRAFEHRLRDFNNLAGTSHDDIGQVLRTARERVGSRLVQSAR